MDVRPVEIIELKKPNMSSKERLFQQFEGRRTKRMLRRVARAQTWYYRLWVRIKTVLKIKSKREKQKELRHAERYGHIIYFNKYGIPRWIRPRTKEEVENG